MSNNTEANTPENTTEITETTEQSTQTAPVLEGAALLEAIQRQVEFYFSEQNLAKDAYLVSQMDINYYVPLEKIAFFSKLRALTEDINLIVEALKNSTVVQLSEDNTRIKPRESERKTLIIYSLPSGTTQEEIEALVQEGGFTATVTNSVMNSFYISFNTAEAAAEAHSFLLTKKIQGQDVRVRVKSETPIRSLYLVDTPLHVPVMYPPYTGVPRGNWNPMNMVPYWDPNNPNASLDYANRTFDGKDSYRGNRNFRKSRKDQRKGQYAGEGKRRSSNRKKGSRDNKKQTNAALQLGPSHFPPLPSAGKKETKAGYTEPFTKYTTEELVAGIQGLGEVPKPNLSDKEPFVAASQNTKLEVLQSFSEGDELQEGVPPPSAVSLSEIIKSNKGKQSSESKPRAANNSAEKTKPQQQEKEKPASKSEKATKQPADKTSKPAGEHRGGNKRTWSQIVTKPEKADKENKASATKVESPKHVEAAPSSPAAEASETDKPANN